MVMQGDQCLSPAVARNRKIDPWFGE